MKKIKYLTILNILFSLIISVAGCSNDTSKQWDPGESRKKLMGIITVPNASLRVDPLIFSSRISQMKKGEAVEVLERSKEMKRIGKSKNYWYKIKLQNGITGWTYGSLVKVIKGSNRENINKYLDQFWAKETEELKKAFHGKWWSVNKFGDFTSHSLEIYSDGKYKSYYKRSKRKIEGEYTFDFNDNSIVFSKGTSFKNNLRFFKRGASYVLAKETDKSRIMFKKININPQTEDEKEEEKRKKEEKSAKTNKTQKAKNGSKTQ